MSQEVTYQSDKNKDITLEDWLKALRIEDDNRVYWTMVKEINKVWGKLGHSRRGDWVLFNSSHQFGFITSDRRVYIRYKMDDKTLTHDFETSYRSPCFQVKFEIRESTSFVVHDSAFVLTDVKGALLESSAESIINHTVKLLDDYYGDSPNW